jgi:TIR domain
MDLGPLRRSLARLFQRPGRGAAARHDQPGPQSPGGLSIYISYRREDSAPVAKLVHDALAAQLGSQRVFMDVESIGAGSNWVETVRRAFDSFGIVLALIGRNWNPPAPDHRPRLEDPSDFVRVELEMALERRVTVIPVLVDGAMMPADTDLPPSLERLTRSNAFELKYRTLES